MIAQEQQDSQKQQDSSLPQGASLSQHDASRHQQGFSPVQLGGSRSGLSGQAKALFFRQLASGVGSGLPLARAVQLAATGLPPKMQRDMAEVAGANQPLSRVLARYPAAFAKYELALVQAGEKSGRLDTNLKKLAEHAESQHTRHNQQLAQAVYPLLLIHAAAIIPAFPLWVTKGSCAFWGAVSAVLLPLYGVAAVVYVLQRWARFNATLDNALCAVANAIPILATWRRKEALARFLTCFSQLQDAGILASESLVVASASCGNVVLGRRLDGVARSLDQGQRLSQALRETGLWAEQVLAMLATGEETGHLVEMSAKAAEILQQEAESSRQKLAAIVPVLVLLAVGAFVGYQVLGLFQGLTHDLNEVM